MYCYLYSKDEKLEEENNMKKHSFHLLFTCQSNATAASMNQNGIASND